MTLITVGGVVFGKKWKHEPRVNVQSAQKPSSSGLRHSVIVPEKTFYVDCADVPKTD